MTDAQTYFRVERLLADYARAIDDDRLEDWPDFFAPDCLYKIISTENFEQGLPLGIIHADSQAMLQDRVSSIRRANIFEDHRYKHFVSATQITYVDGNIVRATSNYQVIRIDVRGNAMLFSVGKYLDVIDLSGARPLFREKVVVFDNERVDTLLALPL
jgi:anthranilate 1,2-dioxygenase small subunit